MPEFSQESRLWLLAGAVATMLSLGACSSFTERSRGALSAITPYKVEVVQGNFVSKEQVDLLKAGMSRQQVREILGTPLLTDVFHTNRWDYVFTIRRQGVDPQQRRLTVFFNGDVLDRFEGDTMPSEQEFVAAVDARGRAGKVPVLEATEDQLKKFEPSKDKGKDADADSSSASLPPLPPSYPPLEAAR
ncbi:Outer membrane protein assembly factor BamE precursor [Variovorax sp. PBS-H4]|uniref:outer membrane protein assembly factor BamE n=1 Tax=Variovorax sp. PBS-H4 TaxID=434008 RepID=UPI0013184E4D|nr:Outer membrane protein assembly factor BamE precursor [Variovorax sp. PBS-H4]